MGLIFDKKRVFAMLGLSSSSLGWLVRTLSVLLVLGAFLGGATASGWAPSMTEQEQSQSLGDFSEAEIEDSGTQGGDNHPSDEEIELDALVVLIRPEILGPSSTERWTKLPLVAPPEHVLGALERPPRAFGAA